MASWRHTWTTAITKPSVNTYTAMCQDPKANAWRPTLWIILAGLIAAILALGADYLTHQVAYRALTNTDLAIVAGPRLLIGVIGSLLGFVIFVGVQHLIAQRLGGRGTFGQQAYVVGAIMAPLLILTTVVASLPIINIASPFIALFGLIIEIVAIKAVYNFGWIKTLLSSFVIWIFVAALLLGGLLYLLGPSIGAVFSNIVLDT